jgi:hypothetical protein
MDRSGLGVVRAVYQAADAGVNERARAHGARFNCSKEVAVAEAVVTEVLTSFAERDDLGVGGGVVVGEVAIPSAADDAIAMNDDGSDGHLARVERALGGAQGFLHPEFVGVEFVWLGGDFVGQWLIRSSRRLSPQGSCCCNNRSRDNRAVIVNEECNETIV